MQILHIFFLIFGKNIYRYAKFYQIKQKFKKTEYFIKIHIIHSSLNLMLMNIYFWLNYERLMKCTDKTQFVRHSDFKIYFWEKS